jgi:hypothetical protein
MIICAFENSPSIPSFLMTKIVYIGYGQLKKNDSFSFDLEKTLKIELSPIPQAYTLKCAFTMISILEPLMIVTVNEDLADSGYSV